MSAHRPEKVRLWRATLDAWKRPGQTVNAFCRARQLTRSNFDRWRRILSADPEVSRPPPPPAFVPVRVVFEPMAEDILRSGIVVRVPLGAAADAGTRMRAVAIACNGGRQPTETPPGKSGA